MDELQRAREGSGNIGGAAVLIESHRMPSISLSEKIELNKKKGQSIGGNGADNGSSFGGPADVQKLKATIKKLEEQKELISIEKEQLDGQMKERVAQTEDLKYKLRNSAKSNHDLQEIYLVSLRQLRELNSKLHLIASTLDTKDPIETWLDRVEDLNRENEKVIVIKRQLRKELKARSQGQPSTYMNGGKPSSKSSKKSVSKDKPQGEKNGETTMSLLQLSLEEIEKFNTNYIKDLTSEYYILEQEFDEYRYTQEIRSSQIEREEEISSLRREVVSLRNQRELQIIDINKPDHLHPGSPLRLGGTSMGATTFCLGKSPVPRDEIYDETQMSYPRKLPNADDSMLTESRPRKRMADADGKVKELLSADAKHFYAAEHKLSKDIQTSRFSPTFKHK